MCFQQIVKIAVINQSVCCYISATQTISTKGKYLDNSDKEIPWISPSWSTLRLLVVEHIQILYLFEQTRKGIRMTRIRLKRERETLDAAGFAWSNPMYEARTLL